MGMMPSYMVANQGSEYDYEVELPFIPSRFDFASILSDDFRSVDYLDIVPITGYEFKLSNVGVNDTSVWLYWSVNGALAFTHQHYVLGFPLFKIQMSPYPKSKSSVLGENEFFVRCDWTDIPEVFVEVGYNSTEYNNLNQAWEDGHISVLVAFMGNATTVPSLNLWSVFASLFTFSTPNVHIALNLVIGVVLWGCVIVTGAWLWDKIKPFG